MIAVGVRVLLADNNEARFGMPFHKIGKESASGWTRGVSIDDVNLRDGRLEIAHIGRERGFELLADDLELSLRQNALEFAEHQRVRRQDAN